ncbi:hypothetical protein QYE76_046849 [Lolium multiflorum]|uniref:Protein FAR1-RELATED SEQUENCE n=1 Tax=Lolium multiflorum TaxID=4521 RepID=A0AAD8TP34_LOLMU|nr:hypothetical protein QYE76_046849 [Lolium multiflorum]
MAHLLRSVMYPPPGHKNHLVPPPIVASSSGSNQGPRRRAAADTANARAGEPLQQPIHGRFNNPPVFFNQNPEDDQPAASGFVADSILQGFDLNKPAQTEGYDGADQDGNDAAKFVPGPNSTASAGASNVAEEDGEEICSQPVVPFVGMMFDDLEVAKQVYNDYAWKLGFGTRIGNTKYSTARGVPKDTILSRVFECVHTGKLAAECKNAAARSKEAAAKVKEASVDMSNIGEQKLWLLQLTSYSIEEQALKFYTREVFDRFQKMVQSSTRFYPIHVEAEGLCFDLVPNQDLDVKTYRVAVNPEEGLYTCGCNMFEMCGLICPHIIRVMVHLNVQQIPGRYMLERWSAAATTHAPEPGTNTIRFGIPSSWKRSHGSNPSYA